MSRVLMGGSFDVLHVGHRALLARAFEVGDEAVFIGVTSDAFANAHRDRKVRPYEERVRDLQELLDDLEVTRRAQVGPIDDAVGRGLEAGWDAIVVTPDTLAGADVVNAARRRKRLPPLEVHVAPMVVAEDGERVSATRIRRGEIDADGNVQGPLKVVVGSANPAKVAAVARALTGLGREADVRGVEVVSTAPEQPWGEETWQGAAARAAAALAEAPDAHVAVGVEAGLMETPWGLLDVQCVVTVDRGGRATAGHGAGFPHPPRVEEAVADGASVGEAYAPLVGDDEVGRREGAIGYLTRGGLDREALTVQGVHASWAARVRPHLHGLKGAPPEGWVRNVYRPAPAWPA